VVVDTLPNNGSPSVQAVTDIRVVLSELLRNGKVTKRSVLKFVDGCSLGEAIKLDCYHIIQQHFSARDSAQLKLNFTPALPDTSKPAVPGPMRPMPAVKPTKTRQWWLNPDTGRNEEANHVKGMYRVLNENQKILKDILIVLQHMASS
jgi:hypothetical protein